MYVRIGANLATAGALRHPNGAGERTGFRADFTAKCQAKTAIDTGAASEIRLRKNGHGRGERMPAKLLRGALEEHARSFHGQRRHGIRLGARGIKRAGAREARYAYLPLDP